MMGDMGEMQHDWSASNPDLGLCLSFLDILAVGNWKCCKVEAAWIYSLLRMNKSNWKDWTNTLCFPVTVEKKLIDH